MRAASGVDGSRRMRSTSRWTDLIGLRLGDIFSPYLFEVVGCPRGERAQSREGARCRLNRSLGSWQVFHEADERTQARQHFSVLEPPRLTALALRAFRLEDSIHCMASRLVGALHAGK